MFVPQSFSAAMFAALAVLWGAGTAIAQSTIRPADERIVIKAEGVDVTLVIRSEVTLTNQPQGGIQLGLRAKTRLDDLQLKAPDILRAMAKRETDCRTRWSFPGISPVLAQESRLRIEGQVHAEKWLCEKVLGREVKTRVASARADFIVTLRPVHAPNEVAIAATIEKLDLSSGVPDDLEKEVKRKLSASLDKSLAGNDKKLKIPAGIASLQPRFTKAHIAALQGGKGELEAEAEAVIRTAEDLARVMEVIARRGKAQ